MSPKSPGRKDAKDDIADSVISDNVYIKYNIYSEYNIFSKYSKYYTQMRIYALEKSLGKPLIHCKQEIIKF